MTRRQLSKAILMSLGLWLLLGACILVAWANLVVSDPDDLCSDASVSRVARFISCSMEGR